MPKNYLRDKKAREGMKVQCLTTMKYGEIIAVDVPKDVEVPDDAQNTIRVGNDDSGYVLVRYNWTPGGVNVYAPARGYYGVVKPQCLVDRKSRYKLTL